MAHFAELDENNIVKRIVVVSNQSITNPHTYLEEEILGIAICLRKFGGVKWVQTSYNASFRKKYACVGDWYVEELDVFISPKPFPSWILDPQTGKWESPIGPSPDVTDEDISNKVTSYHLWDEDLYQSDKTKGWVLVTEITQ